MAILEYEFILRGRLVVFIITHKEESARDKKGKALSFKATNGFEIGTVHGTRIQNNGHAIIWINIREINALTADSHSAYFDCPNEAAKYVEVATEALNEFIANGGFTKPKPKTVWELKKGDEYRTIEPNGGEILVWKWEGCYSDNQYRDFGNIFLTSSEAKKERYRRFAEAKLVRLIAEFNDGWEPDWSDQDQKRAAMLFNTRDKRCVLWWADIMTGHNKFYLKSKDIPEPLFKEMSRLLKISIGIEQ